MFDYKSYRHVLFEAIGKEPPPVKEKNKSPPNYNETERNIIHYRHYLLNELVKQQVKITRKEIEKVKAFMETDEGKDGYKRFLKSFLAKELFKKNKKAQSLFNQVEKILKDRAKS